MLERIRARLQDLIHYIRTRDVQYWNYRIAGPARFAFAGNLILIFILAYIDIIPPEMQPPFLLAWIVIQMVLAAIAIGASLMAFNLKGRAFIGVSITLIILLTVIVYLLLR